MVTTPEGKIIHFGASGYSDYTIHKDNARKDKYIMRHIKNENWNDLNTPGCWSRFVLWNQTTIKKSIKDMENRFNIDIEFNI